MRIVASLQSKRGSSRGLVHYIARSKIVDSREPTTGRELFNEFSNNLSVESSNNSLKIGLSKQRVSNDSLHHLVISRRDMDFRKLGNGEESRKAALRDITRTGMDALKARCILIRRILTFTTNPCKLLLSVRPRAICS